MAKHRPAWARDNVAFGISCSTQDDVDRMLHLLFRVRVRWRFVSLEPLLGPVMLGVGDPRATGEPFGEFIDSVIVGGETGPGARPMHPDWVRSVRDQCAAANVPFYFKSWGDWVPEDQAPAALSARTAGSALYIAPDGSTSPARWGARAGRVTVQRVGSKAAGRRLDGRTHDDLPWEMPETR
jgi:protein gp37